MTTTIAPPVKTNGKPAAARAQEVHFMPLELRTIWLEIVGTSPLIMHAWSEKAKKAMRDKQQKKASRGREARNPEADFLSSMYVIDAKKEVYGFPAIAFKASAVSAAIQVDAKKTHMRSCFHIENGVETPQGDLVPIRYDRLTQREDTVRIDMGRTADLRYRAEFQAWSTRLKIVYNARMISLEQLVALFDAAGFGIGVGEWRPERNGMNGRFKVGNVYDDNDARARGEDSQVGARARGARGSKPRSTNGRARRGSRKTRPLASA